MAHDIFAIESPVQKRAWFHTSKDEIFKVHMDWTHWTVDPRIVRAFIDRSGDTIAWLEAMGMRFELLPMYPNQSPLIRHALKGRGVELCRLLRRRAEELGATIAHPHSGQEDPARLRRRHRRGAGRRQGRRGQGPRRVGHHHHWRLRQQPRSCSGSITPTTTTASPSTGLVSTRGTACSWLRRSGLRRPVWVA